MHKLTIGSPTPRMQAQAGTLLGRAAFFQRRVQVADEPGRDHQPGRPQSLAAGQDFQILSEVELLRRSAAVIVAGNDPRA